MQSAPVTIDNGFGKPYNGTTATDGGNPQSENRDTKPDNPVQQPANIAGIPVIDPIIYSDPGNDGFRNDGGTTTDSQPRKRRGRPPGSKNGVRTEAPKTSSNLVANLESLLISVHIMGAAFLDWEELELDPEEAKRMSDAIKEVGKHYAMEIDPKKLALIELSVVCAGIYGPRVVSAWRKGKKNVAEKQAAGPQPIKRDTEKAAQSGAINIEGRSVDRAFAQQWASQGVE